MGFDSLGLEFFLTQGPMAILEIIVFAGLLIDMPWCSLAGHGFPLFSVEAVIKEELTFNNYGAECRLVTGSIIYETDSTRSQMKFLLA